MSLEQYNVNTNPFLALSGMIKNKDAGGKASLGHAMIMQQVHHAGVMEHLERSHELQSAADAVAHRRDLAKQRISHGQALELESVKAQNASQISAQTHAQTIEAATHQAGIAEAASASTHTRNLELMKGIKGAAKPGTKIEMRSGDVNFSFTKSEPKPRAPKKTAVQPAATQPAAPEVKTPGLVGRDPKTGRAISLKK